MYSDLDKSFNSNNLNLFEPVFVEDGAMEAGARARVVTVLSASFLLPPSPELQNGAAMMGEEGGRSQGEATVTVPWLVSEGACGAPHSKPAVGQCLQ